MTDTNTKYEQGLAIRRSVLGEDYVNKSLAEADDFTRPLQELITEYAWGTAWTRPGLPLKTRSLLTITMLVALNRLPELKLHLHGALRNGCTKEEIQETLLQTAIYCGVPAAMAGFRVATEVMREAENK